jgi:hypothetical protein
MQFKKKKKLKTISFRIDSDLVIDFRRLCNEYGVKQVSIIEDCMKKAVLELEKKIEEERIIK